MRPPTSASASSFPRASLNVAAPLAKSAALPGARCEVPLERRTRMDTFLRNADPPAAFASRVATVIETAGKAELGRLQSELQEWASAAAASLARGEIAHDDPTFLRWSQLDHALSNAIAAPEIGSEPAVDTAAAELRKLASSMPFAPLGLAANASKEPALREAEAQLPPPLRALASNLNALQRNAASFRPLTEHRLVAGSTGAVQLYERWHAQQVELLAPGGKPVDPAERGAIEERMKQLQAGRNALLVDGQALQQAIAVPAQLTARYKMLFDELQKASNSPPGPARDRKINAILGEMRSEIASTDKRLAKAIAELDRIIASEVHTGSQLRRDKKEGNHIHDPELHRQAQALRAHLTSVQASLPALWTPMEAFIDGAAANPSAAALAMAKPPAGKTTV